MCFNFEFSINKCGKEKDKLVTHEGIYSLLKYKKVIFCDKNKL